MSENKQDLLMIRYEIAIRIGQASFTEYESIIQEFEIKYLDLNITSEFRYSGFVIPEIHEAIEATEERLYTVTKIKHAMEQKIDALYLGGSLAYGEFCTVRKTSDVDLMAITDNPLEIIAYLKTSRIFPEEEITQYQNYIIKVLKSGQKPEVITYKLKVNNYFVGIDIISNATFDTLFGDEFLTDILNSNDSIHSIRVASTYPAADLFFKQPGVNGDIYEYGPSQNIVEQDGVYYSDFPRYIIQDGIWFSGLFQNVLLPKCMILAGNSTIHIKMIQFRKKINEYIFKLNEGATCVNYSILNAHPKSELLKILTNLVI